MSRTPTQNKKFSFWVGVLSDGTVENPPVRLQACHPDFDTVSLCRVDVDTKLRTRNVPIGNFRLANKAVRYWQYRARFKSWRDVVAPTVLQWLDAHIADQLAERDLGHMDNFRVCDPTIPSQKRRYLRQKQTGCCGSSDWQVECPIDGKTYWVGFNYGH